MSDYRSNFDEFGNLRENHSPWTLPDLIGVVVFVGVVVMLISGRLG